MTDDGSNNEAKGFIESSYPWVKWVEGPKKGPAANRNNGAKHAKGEWLVFTDDDCIPNVNLLNAYQKQVDQNNVKVFEGRISSIGDNKSPLMHAPVNEEGGLLWSCNFCINKDLFESLNGFDENFKYAHLEDVDLCYRLNRSNESIKFVYDAFVTHPWRILMDGNKLGKMHESDIYFQIKNGTPPTLARYLFKLINYRFRRLIMFPLSIDSFKLIQETSIELKILLKNFHKWKQQYTPNTNNL